jgi:hypothetical protein
MGGGVPTGRDSAPARPSFSDAARLARTRAIRDGVSIVGVISVLAFLLAAYGPPGYDSYAYWHVDALSPYHFDGNPGQLGAFRYSPAIAQALAVLNWLPWAAFFWLWIGTLLAALAWLGREWTLALLAAPFVVLDIYMGNIEVLIAAAIVAGVRYPFTWSFVLLTKITPGIGLLWFVVRREWRNLAIALGATALIVLVSFAIAPNLWFDWPRQLATVDAGEYLPFLIPVRLLVAALLVVWGARTDRPWTLVVAGTLALAWLDFKTLAMLVGLGAYFPSTRGAPATAALDALRDGIGSLRGSVAVRVADRVPERILAWIAGDGGTGASVPEP